MNKIEKLDSGGTVNEDWRKVNEVVDAVNRPMEVARPPNSNHRMTFDIVDGKIVFNLSECGVVMCGSLNGVPAYVVGICSGGPYTIDS